MSWEERFWEEFGDHFHTWDKLQEALAKIELLEKESITKEVG